MRSGALYCEDSTVMYAENEFKQVLGGVKSEVISKAFKSLETEIKGLSEADQVIFYSDIAQLLQRLMNNSCDQGIAIDIFILKCQVNLHGKNPGLKKLGLALAVVGISLGVLVAGLSLGFGIGAMLGVWSTPMAFLPSLLAMETPALWVASTTAVASLASAAYSAFSFFKESSIERALRVSVDAIKQNSLKLASPRGVSAKNEVFDEGKQVEREERAFVEDCDEEGEKKNEGGFGL